MAESVRQQAPVQTGLKPETLGLVSATMQAITHIAPAIAALFFTQFLVTLAGLTAPLAYLIGVLVVLMLGPSGRENMGYLLLELMFPVRDLGGMHPVYTRELVDRFVSFDGVQRNSGFELSAITLPLCRHLLSPPPSHIDTAFYLNHLSSFRGTL